MIQRIEAIYSNGVLHPIGKLDLREDARVRITVEPMEDVSAAERAAALQRFRERAARMTFRSNGPYPTRDELHERR